MNKLAKASEQDKKRQEAATGVLQNLAKIQKAQEAKKAQEQKVKKQEAQSNVASNLSNVISQVKTDKPSEAAAARITISELDRLRLHISSFWNPPPGAASADRLKVDIYVRLEPDGTVLEASVEDTKRYNGDRVFRAAANAALRAVLDASPLPLPEDKYDQWKEFIFGFDPRFISG